MALELVLVIIGTAVQLFGVAVTIKGAREVWRDVASPDDRFLAPFITLGRRIEATVRRWIGRPRNNPVQMSGTMDNPAFEIGGTGTLTWGEFPPERTADERIEALRGMLNQAILGAHEHVRRVESELDTKIAEVRREREALERKVDEGSDTEQKRAVRGLRTEAYGFILLTIGTLIQTAGTLAGF